MLARQALGRVLRDIRKSKGMTLSDLTPYLSLAHLSEIERGNSEVSSEVLRTISDGLGVSVGHILVEAGYLMSESEMETKWDTVFGAV
jgi:transcriptional regulator with XRE-family HTH domain